MMRIESTEKVIRAVVICRHEKEFDALGEFIVRQNALGEDPRPPEEKDREKAKDEAMRAMEKKAFELNHKANGHPKKEKPWVEVAKSGPVGEELAGVQKNKLDQAKELVAGGMDPEEAYKKIYGDKKVSGFVIGKLREISGGKETKKTKAFKDVSEIEAEITDYLKDGPAKAVQIYKFVGGDENLVDEALHNLRISGKVVKEGYKYQLKGWTPPEGQDEETSEETPEQEGESEPEDEKPSDGPGDDGDAGDDIGDVKMSKSLSHKIKPNQFSQLVDFIESYKGKSTTFELDDLDQAIGAPDYIKEWIHEQLKLFGASQLRDELRATCGVKIHSRRVDGVLTFEVVEA